MKLIRIQSSARKTIIYHPSFRDVWNRIRCFVGAHAYELVREYRSVGAKEEMCLHCLKERYSLNSHLSPISDASNAA